jgi:multicomponent Na+:H+ antiporter subunit B
MSLRARTALFAVSAAVVAAGLMWSFLDLPDFGQYAGVYGLTLQGVALTARHATDIVATVTFDYRAVDTLGEEFILFTAAVGCAILLRAQRGEDAESDGHEPSSEEARRPVRALASALVAPLIVLGAYVVSHGHLTPGGGFQGGVVISAAFVVAYLGERHVRLRRVDPETAVEAADAIGAAGFALIGIGGLVFAAAALENFLPLGEQGDLLSAGTIPLANVAVGIEVAGAVTLIVEEFLDQALLRRARG